jgi:hypothetical protein
VLLHTPLFVNWLIYHENNCTLAVDRRDKCLACLFRQLSVLYWTVGPDVLALTNRANTISAYLKGSQDWPHEGEQDAGEYLNVVLRAIQESLTNHNPM